MQAQKTAGYSGTPLSKKLGIVENSRVLLLDAPEGYAVSLNPLPNGVTFSSRPGHAIDVAQVFVSEQRQLERRLASLRGKLRADAALWISWPKKSAKVPTDITEDTIRRLALPLGFVDVKVCAVDATWSGLKLVVRKELR
jgi:hypothetical protein